MTKEEIIEQIEKSFSEYKGTNEAIDDAAYWIESDFLDAKQLLKLTLSEINPNMMDSAILIGRIKEYLKM